MAGTLHVKRGTGRTGGIWKLAGILAAGSTMLIVLQDNPDPDAIASALALRVIASTAGVRCTIVHGGSVGRAENRALVKYLRLRLRGLSDVDWKTFDLVALVDTQPGTGNNRLPSGVIPDIVVDHHPPRRESRHARFRDIRPDYGATSTILWEYLQQANIPVSAPLATALLYGIRSDTQDLERQAARADIAAVEQLHLLANKRVLGQIQKGRVPLSYFRMLRDALDNAVVYRHCVVAALGDVDHPDMIGEVADLFLRYVKARWALVYGRHAGILWFSLRCTGPAGRADDVARRIAAGIGAGGGHGAMAGGQLPLPAQAPALRKLEPSVRSRFLRAVGVGDRKAARLLRPAKRGR